MHSCSGSALSLPAAGPASSPASQPAGPAGDQPGAGLGVVADESWTLPPDGDADSEHGEDSEHGVDADGDGSEDEGDRNEVAEDSEDGVTEFMLLSEGKSTDLPSVAESILRCVWPCSLSQGAAALHSVWDKTILFV